MVWFMFIEQSLLKSRRHFKKSGGFFIIWGEEMFMVIGACTVYMTAEWVFSLKDKRMIVKSIIEKARHKFNISIAEVDRQDFHKNIVIGFACVTNESSHANSIIENVIKFIENITDAVIDDIDIEIL